MADRESSFASRSTAENSMIAEAQAIIAEHDRVQRQMQTADGNNAAAGGTSRSTVSNGPSGGKNRGNRASLRSRKAKILNKMAENSISNRPIGNEAQNTKSVAASSTSVTSAAGKGSNQPTGGGGGSSTSRSSMRRGNSNRKVKNKIVADTSASAAIKAAAADPMSPSSPTSGRAVNDNDEASRAQHSESTIHTSNHSGLLSNYLSDGVAATSHEMVENSADMSARTEQTGATGNSIATGSTDAEFLSNFVEGQPKAIVSPSKADKDKSSDGETSVSASVMLNAIGPSSTDGDDGSASESSTIGAGTTFDGDSTIGTSTYSTVGGDSVTTVAAGVRPVKTSPSERPPPALSAPFPSGHGSTQHHKANERGGRHKKKNKASSRQNVAVIGLPPGDVSVDESTGKRSIQTDRALNGDDTLIDSGAAMLSGRPQSGESLPTRIRAKNESTRSFHTQSRRGQGGSVATSPRENSAKPSQVSPAKSIGSGGSSSPSTRKIGSVPSKEGSVEEQISPITVSATSPGDSLSSSLGELNRLHATLCQTEASPSAMSASSPGNMSIRGLPSNESQRPMQSTGSPQPKEARTPKESTPSSQRSIKTSPSLSQRSIKTSPSLSQRSMKTSPTQPKSNEGGKSLRKEEKASAAAVIGAIACTYDDPNVSVTSSRARAVMSRSLKEGDQVSRSNRKIGINSSASGKNRASGNLRNSKSSTSTTHPRSVTTSSVASTTDQPPAQKTNSVASNLRSYPPPNEKANSKQLGEDLSASDKGANDNNRDSNRAASAAHPRPKNQDELIAPSSLSPKQLKAELSSYGMETESFFDKDSLVDAVTKARSKGWRKPTEVSASSRSLRNSKTSKAPTAEPRGSVRTMDNSQAASAGGEKENLRGSNKSQPGANDNPADPLRSMEGGLEPIHHDPSTDPDYKHKRDEEKVWSSRKKRVLFVGSGLLVVVAAIVGIAIVFTTNNNSKGNEANTNAADWEGTPAPTPMLRLDSLIMMWSPDGGETLQNLPFSPQGVAYAWIKTDLELLGYDHDDLSGYDDSPSDYPPRRIADRVRTRYALSVLNYTFWGGSSTGVSTDSFDAWSHENDECLWARVFCDILIADDLEEDSSDGLVKVLNLEEAELPENSVLPGEIAMLKTLDTLIFTSTNVGSEIPDVFSPMTSLRRLDLDDCLFSGTVPASIGSLKRLEELRLNDNIFDGPLPDFFLNLPNIQILEMQKNTFSGQISESIWSLEQLSDLRLSDNMLTGSISPLIGNLRKLERFWGHTNQLTGIIPREIGSLILLQDLSLDDNQMSGEIPRELGALPLEELWLNTNKFSSSIPTTLGEAFSLVDLYLDENQLTGVIPSELGNLFNCTDLFLNNNKLVGKVPSDLGNMESLNRLRLHSNSLSGAIPSTLCVSGRELEQLTADCAYLPNFGILVSCPATCCTECY